MMEKASDQLLLKLAARFGQSAFIVCHEGEARLVLRAASGVKKMLLKREGLISLLQSGALERKAKLFRITPSGFSAIMRAQKAKESDKSIIYRAQHRTIVPIEDTKAYADLSESPLLRLSTGRPNEKPFLAPYETEAGERLRRDFTMAGISQRITMGWEPRGGRADGMRYRAPDLSDMAIDARKRLEKALMAMEPYSRGLVLDICCYLKGLEEAERERGWPRRSAKLALKIALSQLSVHYGLLPRQHSDGIRHWGGEGYRPSL